MKKKYFYRIIVGIQAICIIAIIFAVYNLLDLKYRREDKYNEVIKSYKYAQSIADRNKDFDEMVDFCENSQKEIELFSKIYISSDKPEISSQKHKDLVKQIAEELDCNFLINTISIDNENYNKENYKNVVTYYYKSNRIYIAYIDKEEECEISYNNFWYSDCYIDRVKKINNHLYVYILSYHAV